METLIPELIGASVVPDAERVEQVGDYDSRFEIEAVVPIRLPQFLVVAESITAVERRVRLAVLLAFLPPQRLARGEDFNALLAEFPRVPLRVTKVSISSVKVTVEGDADEVARFLGLKKAPPTWRRKLRNALLLVVGGGVIGGAILFWGALRRPLNVSPPAEITQKAREACGSLPKGTVFTLKTGVLEIQIPCSDGVTEARPERRRPRK